MASSRNTHESIIWDYNIVIIFLSIRSADRKGLGVISSFVYTYYTCNDTMLFEYYYNRTHYNYYTHTVTCDNDIAPTGFWKYVLFFLYIFWHA